MRKKKKKMTMNNEDNIPEEQNPVYVALWEKIEKLRKEVEQLLPKPRTASESKQRSQIMASLLKEELSDDH